MNRLGIAGALLLSTAVAITPAAAQISFGVSINIAPPPLPVYVQPPLPGPDFLWTPGYWAWDNYAEAYYWVPGTWVRAPRPGLLWTPPWWGWNNGLYLFHAGYWGPHIGFYGGVPYGFGYTGFGYQGGYWNGGHVFYNRTVNNVTNVNVTNVYQSNVTVNRLNRVSYNGGPGGVQARPRFEEQQAERDAHVAPTGNQQAHVAAAHADPQAFASANHGRPPMAATPRPLGNMGTPRPAPRQNFAGRPDMPMTPQDGHLASEAVSRSPDRPVTPRHPDGRQDRFQEPGMAPAFDRPDAAYRQPAPGEHRYDGGGRPPQPPSVHHAPPPRPAPAPHQPPHPHPQGGSHPPHPPAHHDDHHNR